MIAAGAAEEARAAAEPAASRTARAALGFEELLEGDVDAVKRCPPRLRAPPAHLDAEDGGCRADRPHRARRCGASPTRSSPRSGRMAPDMKFEKWQALGNDYVIVESADAALGAHPRAGQAALRAPHRHRLRRDPAALEAGRPRLRRRAADLQPGRVGGRALGQRRARGGAVPAPRPAGRRPTSSRSSRRPARSARRSPGRTARASRWAGPRVTSADYPSGGAGRQRDGRVRRPGLDASSTCRSATRSA